MTFPSSLHLFCRVVDNFGDIGVCWRLARQLRREHGIAVILWVDDLGSFGKICAEVDSRLDEQEVQGIMVRHWQAEIGTIQSTEVADLVIEAFACELPAAYVAAMAVRDPKPVWINLEYLSAEPWVESCHALASRHPTLPLTKHFFFPGFTSKTGGLPVEADLAARRDAFQNDEAARQAFWSALGVVVPDGVRKLSLFCYPSAPVEALFEEMWQGDDAGICLVPEGVASDAVAGFLGQVPTAGARATHGSLTVQVLPFVDQPEYDKLLWACDLNFVRGEDSFVRAQWAGRPLVWHIYPQEDDAHQTKLEAFLDRYRAGLPPQAARALDGLWQAWNGAAGMDIHWRSFTAALPVLAAHARTWAQQLSKTGDLASNLMQFVRQIG